MLDMTVPEVQSAYRGLAEALAEDGVIVLTDRGGSFYWVERDTTLMVVAVRTETPESETELARRIDELPSTTWWRDGDPYVFWKLDDMVLALNAFSDYAAFMPWVGWLCREVLPAMRRHGYYDPRRGHEPPPAPLLDALECREAARQVLDGWWQESGGEVHE